MAKTNKKNAVNNTMAEQLENALDSIKEESKTPAAQQTADMESILAQDDKLGLGEALERIYTGIPSTFRTKVKDSMTFVIRNLQAQSRNWFECGTNLNTIRATVKDKDWKRFKHVLIDRLGQSESTLRLWMENSAVLQALIPNAECRDALLVATNGRGLVEHGKDGNPPTLNGNYTAALKKYPFPVSGTAEDYLDWANTVSTVAERSKEGTKYQDKRFDAALAAIKKLVYGTKAAGKRPAQSGKLKDSVALLVIFYRILDQKSPALVAAAMEAFQDEHITADVAADRAMVEYRHHEETVAAATAAAKSATASTRKPKQTSEGTTQSHVGFKAGRQVA
jgi:hypothetical protein